MTRLFKLLRRLRIALASLLLISATGSYAFNKVRPSPTPLVQTSGGYRCTA